MWQGEKMDQRERIAAVFDRVADTYDQVGVDFFQPIAAGLVAQLAPSGGKRVADLGCGRGAVLLRLARAVGSSGRVDGLDLSPRMVAAAQEAAQRDGLNVHVLVGDAQDPELPEQAFDAVASSLVLFFLPDPGAALRHWRGLLVDGGRLGVSTFGPFSPAWEQVEAVFTPYLPPAMRDARTTGQAGPFGSDAGVEHLLAEAGLSHVRTHTESVAVRFTDHEHWLRWTMSHGQSLMWDLVPPGERDAVRERAFAALEATRDVNPDGRIGFEQQVRYTLGRR
jgi:ubiquinone/menaquinone biosynthesis C-methylase UbiE